MNRRIKKLLPFLAALILALVLELLLFNWKAVFSGRQDWTSLPEPKVSGDLAEDKSVAFFFYDLDRDVSWCHLDLQVRDKDGRPVQTALTVNVSDEGNERIYTVGEAAYFPGHEKGSYFHLNTYGKVHHLTLVLQAPEEGCTWTLLAAEINGAVPFRISIPRILGLFGLFSLLWLLRPGSPLYDNRLWNRRRWVKALCVGLVLLLNVGLLWGLGRSNAVLNQIPEDPDWQHHHQYARLARSLAAGKTRIDTEDQARMLELLAEMDNPYNHSARQAVFEAAGVDCAWDTAYYNGHLYVYFGVVPVLVSYLPYYLLTGNDLSTVWAVILFGALAVLAAFVFLRTLIRRYFPRTPFPAYLLLSLLLGNCTGVLCYALNPAFYVVPVHLSLALVLFALSLWLSAAQQWDPAGYAATPLPDPADCCFAPIRSPGRSGTVDLKIAAGALLAALVAGCRPQFLVFSVLALPIFLPLARAEQKRGITLRRILAFLLPYVAVALPLMYYNQIRFGSPFDFGANYNLTTNDMPHRGFRLSRLPDGFFAYLFAPPSWGLQFPYLRESPLQTLYMGKTIREPMFGGVFLTFPFLWTLLGTRRARPVLREKKLRGLVLLPLLLALIVVAADTEMAGILWRYTEDFLPLLCLSAALVFLALLEDAKPRGRNRLLAFLTVTTILALAACFLISITGSNLVKNDPETYFRFKDLLGWY